MGFLLSCSRVLWDAEEFTIEQENPAEIRMVGQFGVEYDLCNVTMHSELRTIRTLDSLYV